MMDVTGGLRVCDETVLFIQLVSLLEDDVEEFPTERSSLETLAGDCFIMGVEVTIAFAPSVRFTIGTARDATGITEGEGGGGE